VLRATVVLFCASFAFIVGLIVIRRLRRSIDEEFTGSSESPSSLETLPLHVYNTVIQQLKQQKHELQVQTQEEQRRSRTTENFSQAVLSNLSCGVLVFGLNGLVKQSNPAAKEILGFGSPGGMNADDIFRDATIRSAQSSAPDEFAEGASDTPGLVADEVHSVLREGSKRRQVEAEYETPAGTARHISVTVSPVPAADGSLLGAACLINDLSEFENIRRQQELHGEISAEMALDLRTSLTTISGYAQQLASNRDPELARQLASDIASEASRLDRSLGGFLTTKRTAQGRARKDSFGGTRINGIKAGERQPPRLQPTER
jgi:nitrogen fixation/metabolism regulation signal transduction histidine kinase